MSYNFQVVRKGYNPDEVENYIGELEKQLNEFKEKSSTINKAIINAQIAADNIIKAAHSETEKILSQARKDALELKQATISQIKYLKLNIANQKNLIENFRKDYEYLTEKYLNPLITSDVDNVYDKLTEIEETIDEIPNSEVIPQTYRSDKRRQKKEHSAIETDITEKANNTRKEEIISGSATLTPEETRELLS